ncbi:MAG: VaFE repeat-containing surface-anchored protein, partial [Eggerthellaceae bacterium]|nr:VaFE repeat-containing surface-anchored protein [Eggerthellaceae bacterium]
LVSLPIEIGTTATDADDGDHEALADAEVVIVDEVRYKGLVPGKEYTIAGALMDKQMGKAIQQDGKDLTSMVSFKPESPDGSVKVTFKFDGSKLAGHTTVAFESLKADGIELAVHADIEDKDQAVKLVEPPKEQPKKPTPEAPQPTPEPSKGSYTPKTGDEVTANVLAILALAACMALGIALYARRRSCKKATEGLLSDGEEKDEETPSYWRSLYQEK